MTAIPPAQQQGMGGQGQPGMPGTPNPSPSQQTQGLPPTGLQQQLASLNSLYSGISGMAHIGYNVNQQQLQAAQANGTAEMGQQQVGGSSLDAMARNLAQRYGLPIGRGRLVDEYGNFLVTPQQLADASGGKTTLGEAAAQMNYISQAISRRQNEQQQQKGLAALQTGLGQVQSRARGSLAALTSGYYQDIGNLYANKEYEAADFSFYIQKEQQDIAAELQKKQEKYARQQARAQFFMGIALMATGNYVAGGAMTAGSAQGTGWF